MSEDKDIRVVHIRQMGMYYHDSGPKKNGGMTVAFHWKNGDSFITVATAICSNRDQFSRKLGNLLATANFNAGNTIKIPYNKRNEITPTQFIRDMFQTVLENV